MKQRRDREIKLREKRIEHAAMRVKIAKQDAHRPINYFKKVLDGFNDYWDQEILMKKQEAANAEKDVQRPSNYDMKASEFMYFMDYWNQEILRKKQEAANADDSI